MELHKCSLVIYPESGRMLFLCMIRWIRWHQLLHSLQRKPFWLGLEIPFLLKNFIDQILKVTSSRFLLPIVRSVLSFVNSSRHTLTLMQFFCGFWFIYFFHMKLSKLLRLTTKVLINHRNWGMVKSGDCLLHNHENLTWAPWTSAKSGSWWQASILVLARELERTH